VSINGLLIQKDGRAGYPAGGVVEIGDHVEQFVLSFDRSAVAEEGLVHLPAVVGDGDVLLRVGRHAAAVLVLVFVAVRLVGVPEAPVAVVLEQ
jgi:hypothetical protein